MKRALFVLFLIFSVLVPSFCQKAELLRFSVEAGKFPRIDTPVSLDLSGIIVSDTLTLQLFELVNGKQIEVTSQVEPGVVSRLWWVMNGTTSAGSKRDYILFRNPGLLNGKGIRAQVTPEKIELLKDQTKILDYQLAMHYPPKGIDTAFRRNGFIHPLFSPSGNILTRIDAPDHYHHLGIWNPWTKVKIRNHVTDFWNLNSHQGTVYFKGINSVTEGPVWGGFNVRQEHIDFQGKNHNEVILNEVWDVRAWNAEPVTGTKAWLVDLTSLLNVATDTAVILEAYRYGGGIGYRATAEWDKDNSWVNTSEGKKRVDADGTKSRWTDVGGMFKDKGTSGIVFFSHPGNREYPEPMRVWPINQNGRGDVYFEFSPIRDHDWILTPGNIYTQKYRMLVYDGKVDPAVVERVWTDFAYPPAIKITK